MFTIPSNALVILSGASGSGKSTFAKRYFSDYTIVSSDQCREEICGDASNQDVSAEAFDLFYDKIKKSLSNNQLTISDSTATHSKARARLIEIARRCNTKAVCIVFDIDENICAERAFNRPERSVPKNVSLRHSKQLKSGLAKIEKENLLKTIIIQDLDNFKFEIKPLPCDYRHIKGPFHLIGDVHGCIDELKALVEKLSDDRPIIFCGDIVDRGPDSAACLEFVMDMVGKDKAYCVLGNHDDKLLRALVGSLTKPSKNLQETLNQIEEKCDKDKILSFLQSLPHHMVLDDGNLVVAHAGLPERYHGRDSKKSKNMAIYGESVHDVNGNVVRKDWAESYRGDAIVVQGHVAGDDVVIKNNVYFIDTGCVYGGQLTALSYPEMTISSISSFT